MGFINQLITGGHHPVSKPTYPQLLGFSQHEPTLQWDARWRPWPRAWGASSRNWRPCVARPGRHDGAAMGDGRYHVFLE